MVFDLSETSWHCQKPFLFASTGRQVTSRQYSRVVSAFLGISAFLWLHCIYLFLIFGLQSGGWGGGGTRTDSKCYCAVEATDHCLCKQEYRILMFSCCLHILSEKIVQQATINNRRLNINFHYWYG